MSVEFNGRYMTIKCGKDEAIFVNNYMANIVTVESTGGKFFATFTNGRELELTLEEAKELTLRLAKQLDTEAATGLLN